MEDIYKCNKCEGNCILTSTQDEDGNSWDKDVLKGQLCSCSEWTKTTEPKNETVEQWEERTGEVYPDDGPVWVKQIEPELEYSYGYGLMEYSGIKSWNRIRREQKFPEAKTIIIVANNQGKPT